MIILHFHLQPQFKNELFHIYFTSKMWKFTDVCMVGGKFVTPTLQTSVKFRDFR